MANIDPLLYQRCVIDPVSILSYYPMVSLSQVMILNVFIYLDGFTNDASSLIMTGLPKSTFSDRTKQTFAKHILLKGIRFWKSLFKMQEITTYDFIVIFCNI